MTALMYCVSLALILLALQTVMTLDQGIGVALVSMAYALLLAARHREKATRMHTRRCRRTSRTMSREASEVGR